MSNISSTSNAVVTTKSPLAFIWGVYVDLPVVLTLSIIDSYVMITILVLGYTGNIMVIGLMPSTIGVSKRMKLFYICIACADLAAIFFIHSCKHLSYYGMAYLTNARSYWVLAGTSFWAKVIVYAFWDMSKGCSGYYLAVMSVERAFVICFPFFAHKFRFKRTCIALCAVTVWCFLVPCFMTSPYIYVTTIDNNNTNLAGMHLAMAIIMELAPIPVIVGTIIVVPITLIERVRSRHKIVLVTTKTKNSAPQIATTEVRSSLITLGMAIIYSMFAGSYCIMAETWRFFGNQGSPLWIVANLFEALSVVSYSLDPYFCILFLPPFRKRITDLLTCML